MSPRQRAEFIVETQRTVVIRRSKCRRAWCPECDLEVDMVNLEDASAFAEITGAHSDRAAAMQGWHVCESNDGALLVCLNSVLKPSADDK